MADKTPRRRTPVSRAPVARPRKLAGQGLDRLDQRESNAEAPAEPPLVEPVETPAAEAPAEPPLVEPVETATAEAPAEPRRRRTTVLAVLVVLLLAAAAGEAWYLWLRDDPTISASRPVVVSPVAAAGTADTATRALVEIVSTSYRDYDEQTEAAAKLMTPAFAKEYRQTAADVRDSIVEDQAEVSVTVLQQAVVTASPQQVQALVFFDQTVAKNGTGPGVTPYRALVTVVRSGDRWLVSAIDTQ